MPSRTGFVSGRFGINNGVISNEGAGAQFHTRTRTYGGPQPGYQTLPRQLRWPGGHDTVCFSNFADRHYATWFMVGWTEFHTPNLKCGAETAEEVNAKALTWLRANAKRDNYYLHINYWDPHRNYTIDSPWLNRFHNRPVDQPWPDAAAVMDQQKLSGRFTPQKLHQTLPKTPVIMPDAIATREDFEHLVDGYDASIAYADHQLGQIVAELESQGVLDETMILVSADHGEAFGEHGIYADHVNADECIHRIPLVVRCPGVVAPGARDAALRYNVDLPATLCDVVGAPKPESWDGQSFLPLWIEGADKGHEYLVWDTGLYTVQRAVRTPSHLYIRTYDQGEYSHFFSEELFDLRQDPYQTKNLVATEIQILADCRNKLQAWLEDQQAKPGWRYDPVESIMEERKSAGRCNLPIAMD